MALLGQAASAQQKPGLAGDYAGTLGQLHLKLHLKADASGALSGTLDSPDQGATGIVCADFLLDGQNLSFTVPTVNGKWSGTVSKDGMLAGTWDQGTPLPLTFAKDTASAIMPASTPAAGEPAAAKPTPIDGIWLGTVQIGGAALRIQVTFKSDASGKELCSLDSLDQGATGLECTQVVFGGETLSFELPVASGKWSGKLSADRKTLAGTWTQGNPVPLNFVRQTALQVAKSGGPASFDPAIPKVKVEDLQGVLDGDLAGVLKGGELSQGTGVGVTIGVVQRGVRKIITYGEAKPDSIFEIGSITKTFTGLILSQLVEQKKAKLDEPVRELLPAGTVAKPAGAEITLLDLATQHSGLPRMPDNFKPADAANPYADYRTANLYAFLGKAGVAKPKDAGYLYSNLGFGLLGQALAERAVMSYPELLKEEITGPLKMKETQIELSAEQKGRFLPGHDADLHPAHPWDLVALAGAGGIRSTAGDMLTYLEANLRPDKIKPEAGFGGSATLSQAIKDSLPLRTGIGPRMSIALAWQFDIDSGVYWHNGETGGYSAYAFFSPLTDTAGVVLINAAIAGNFTDKLGQHIRARLAGDRAISLGK